MFVCLVLLYKRFIDISQHRGALLLTSAFRELHWVSVAGILAPLKSMLVFPLTFVQAVFHSLARSMRCERKITECFRTNK